MSVPIEISAQYGDSDSKDAVRPSHRAMNELFEENLRGRYFQTIQKLSIVFRVSGSIWKFEPEGPDHLRYSRRDKEITIDLVIPESRWRGAASGEIRAYVAQGVKRCFELLVARAKKEKEIIDETGLLADFQKAITEFENAEP